MIFFFLKKREASIVPFYHDLLSRMIGTLYQKEKKNVEGNKLLSEWIYKDQPTHVNLHMALQV